MNMTYLSGITCEQCRLVATLRDGVCELCRNRARPATDRNLRDLLELLAIMAILAALLVLAPTLTD